MNVQKLRMHAREASGLLKAVGNEHRLRAVCYLVEGEKSVGELVQLVGLSQSALSQHLARLRRAGLVKTRRDGQTIFYSIAADEISSLMSELSSIYSEPRTKSGTAGRTGRRQLAVAS